MTAHRKQLGVTLIELLIAVALGALIVAGMSAVMGELTQTQAAIQERNRLTENGRFAMDRMVRTLSHSRRLLLPLADNPGTNWREHVREQTVPASAPIGDSTFASAVLAVALPEYVDLDADGFPDADDDRDGRIDEDLPNDIHQDSLPGIIGIDDDGDGSVDENPSWYWDDDEDGTYNEDPNGHIDNDGDAAFSEDPSSDNNSDGCPGICGVDDDEDGLVDEGDNNDDDEDGVVDEDWLEAIVFYLQGDSLIERHPVPWDETANGSVTGRDFIESVIAEGVMRFRVERLIASSPGSQAVDITLELSGPDGGETVSLHTQIRVGGAP